MTRTALPRISGPSSGLGGPYRAMRSPSPLSILKVTPSSRPSQGDDIHSCRRGSPRAVPRSPSVDTETPGIDIVASSSETIISISPRLSSDNNLSSGTAESSEKSPELTLRREKTHAPHPRLRRDHGLCSSRRFQTHTRAQTSGERRPSLSQTIRPRYYRLLPCAALA